MWLVRVALAWHIVRYVLMSLKRGEAQKPSNCGWCSLTAHQDGNNSIDWSVH